MKFSRILPTGIAAAVLLCATACGSGTPTATPNTNRSTSAASGIHQKNTPPSHTGAGSHGLPTGETLTGGNPVAPAPVPALQHKQYQTPIPVSVLHVTYAYPVPKVPSLPSEVRMSLPTDLASKLTAYYFPLGSRSFYIVAPNGMKGKADVGQDGSYKLALKNPEGTELYLSSSGACQGCAADAAAMYFTSARKDAVDYGGPSGPYFQDLPVKMVTVNSQLITLAYAEQNKKQLAGFAYYLSITTTHGQGTFLSEKYVASGQDVQNLAPWIFQNTLLQQKIPF
ncbi:Domain of unknown function (DUF4850) [Acididesulfobacillus acetoxydans]|uniref:Lipoprotein n=2 Tax=Acididesulfobacillus acetoxydans TaxID=1561005 RepID=A0A8S0W9P8_9FIRM|nr:Domain of unknown function (DUF4850) [Acididesulfobacillus acetoxydans]CEJ06374.1 Hypothetical protein DEACI_0822 [Acididesulfobacillus acetoxydans]